MEAKAHSRETYNKAGQVSWMEQDLVDYSNDLKASFKVTPIDKKYDALLRDRCKNLHVCVVGAGFAGLRCAEVLIERGARVTILEARNRIGGRVGSVHQVDLLDNIIDMGPNWIHGTLSNPILNLAKKTETALCLVGDNMWVFDQLGQLIDKAKATELFDVVWDIISDAFKHSNEDCLNISPRTSLKDFFKQKVCEKKLSEADQALILQIGEMWGAFIGDSWDKQSLKYFWLEECLDGENFYVASSHGPILQSIAASVANKADIQLNTKVIGVESKLDGGNPKVLVATDDQVLEFDEVVITVPVGCLKRQEPTFTPPLPATLTRAIKNTSYSSLEKVYLTFPSAFWDTMVAELGSSTNDAQLPSFSHFLHPTYSAENPESWSLELHSLSSPEIFRSHAQPTLLFSIYGSCAAHITSLIAPHSSSSPEYFKIINDFFRPYYSLLPNFSLDDPQCHPKAVLATNWQNDPLAGYGSYVNFKVSEDPKTPEEKIKLEEDLKVLRWGCPERGVWLAGEHTAPFVALGTLTGAYWSGEAAAMKILRANGLASDSEIDAASTGPTGALL